MSILNTLRRWTYEYQCKFGNHPRTIPVSMPEMLEIETDIDLHLNRDYERQKKNQILGLDVEMSPWAEMTRQRIIEIGVERLSYAQEFDESSFVMTQSRDPINRSLLRTLTAHILTDVTHLDVSFDWDRLAWLKRRVNWIGRKWPVKRKTVRIEGKVLYPYLKIQAPADTHRVRFTVQP